MRSKRKRRIQDLTDYLVKVNLGKDVAILSEDEDEFSILEDEIYKTVTEMRNVKEMAVRAKKNYADSLADIAHQIKTPITALSAMVQLLEGKVGKDEVASIESQIGRIHHLTDALLTISKIDAGILELKKEDVDVYTMLELAVEALDGPLQQKNIEVVLPNHPEVSFVGDMDWSVEVFINLIKNSMEHLPKKGILQLEYEKNALYVEIRVMDNGEGFKNDEIPHIFERFYRGRQATKSGTGIGLSMAKSIIEMQRGFITAQNLAEGGACFLIRFYNL